MFLWVIKCSKYMNKVFLSSNKTTSLFFFDVENECFSKDSLVRTSIF